MPVNPDSRMRKTRVALYGWKAGDVFYLSIRPKSENESENAARNEYASAVDALREASKRNLPIVWEDPAVIL